MNHEPLTENQELKDKLGKLGIQLISIPPPTGEELHRLEGWRAGIEEHGQALWGIYHWIVKAQDGQGHGIYRLRDWLEQFNVPDNTDGSGEFPIWR